MKDDLKKLGLTENEIKVYLSLLKIGETPVGGIINDLKIHRQIAYNALNALEKKEMVISTLKNKVHHYKVNDPKAIIGNIQKQELIAKRLSKNIEKEIKKSYREHEISVYDGQERIRKDFLNAIIDAPHDITIYVTSAYVDRFEKILGAKYLLEKYHKIRRKKGILGKNIAKESDREKMEALDKNAGYIREIRYLPDELIPPIGMSIWPDRVILSFFEKDWFNITIKNQSFRDVFFNYFQTIWKIAKK